jgi:hypothetical protein
MEISERIIRRFNKFVDKTDGDACWNWLGVIRRDGYGKFNVNNTTRLAAHRVSYMLFVGPIPQGQWVLHRCDNRSCVRPDHLFVGTHADNMKDKSAKGRATTKYAPTKINMQIASDIRALLSNGTSKYEIERRYGLSRPTIRKIERNEIWRTT